MSACVDCSRARESNGAWRFFDPACLWCGARLVQQIGRFAVGAEAIKARRLKVLADWHAHGHSRDTMRELAKATALPLQPAQQAKGRGAAA